MKTVFILHSHAYDAREIYDLLIPVLQHPEPCVEGSS